MVIGVIYNLLFKKTAFNREKFPFILAAASACLVHFMAKNSKTVPVHGAKDLGKGLLNTIEKQTGVKLT